MHNSGSDWACESITFFFVYSSSWPFARVFLSFPLCIHRKAEKKANERNIRKMYEQSLLLACWRVGKKQRKTKKNEEI